MTSPQMLPDTADVRLPLPLPDTGPGAVPPLAGVVPGTDPDTVLELLGAWAAADGLTLYPHQEEALLELASGSHVVLSTPTGSGKSLVAVGAHALALAEGRRSFYTAPIKALVSEKFFALCEVFGAERVGMMTGDAGINTDAPVVCATAEVLANLALRQGRACRGGPGRDGRVPLLRRPRPGLGLAGAAHRAGRRPVPADERDAGRHAGRSPSGSRSAPASRWRWSPPPSGPSPWPSSTP
jgi:hypothetical protein